MIPHSDNPFQEPPTKRGSDSGLNLSAILLIPVLALGMLAGLAIGWISFGSEPTTLFDETLVSSLFEDASRAVVEISVERPGVRSGNAAASGSGFFVDDAGHIVTNHHVLDGGGDVSVLLFDGRILPATKLGTSPADDLALLRIDPSEVSEIEPLPLADSDKVRPGQMAIAIGSPFRQANSVSVGVVSGTGRDQQSVLRRPIPNLIQTDAALNPGNSGGPLLDSNGEVIGINSSVVISSSVQIGVGFAIPSNTLDGILTALMTPAELKRPWLGIESRDFNPEAFGTRGLPVDKGIYILRVCSGSPADRIGLRADPRPVPIGQADLITAVDGNAVGSVSEMVSYLNTLQPGDQVALTILRDEKTQDIDVTLDEWQACR